MRVIPSGALVSPALIRESEYSGAYEQYTDHIKFLRAIDSMIGAAESDSEPEEEEMTPKDVEGEENKTGGEEISLGECMTVGGDDLRDNIAEEDLSVYLRPFLGAGPTVLDPVSDADSSDTFDLVDTSVEGAGEDEDESLDSFIVKK